jgi:hypothetical protein
VIEIRNLLHQINAVSKQGFGMFFFSDRCKYVSEFHVGEQRGQMLLEIGDI